jgi:hypothetical protein
MTRRSLPPLLTPLSLVDVVGAPVTDEPPAVRVFAPSATPHPLLLTGSFCKPRAPPLEVVPPPPFPAVPEPPPVPVPPVLIETPPLAPAVPEPPVLVEPPLLVAVVEPPVLVLPPLLGVVLEPPLLPPAPEELPPLALLLAGAELPPLGVLLTLLDVPEEPPWLDLVLAAELPPVDPLPPPESLVQDTTSAGRPTHKVAKSIFLMGEPPNRELRTGDSRTSSICESSDGSIDSDELTIQHSAMHSPFAELLFVGLWPHHPGENAAAWPLGPGDRHP